MINRNDMNSFALLVGRAGIYVADSRTLWVIVNKISVLIEISLDEKRVVGCYWLSEEKRNNEYSYMSMKQIKNKLIMVPYNADVLLIFDMEKHSIERKIIPIKGSGKHRKFIDVLIGDGCLYLIGFEMKQILKYDMRLDKWGNIYEENNSSILSRTNGLMKNGNFMIFSADEMSYIVFENKQEKARKIQIDCELKGKITACALVEDTIYLGCDDGNLVEFNKDMVVKTSHIYDDYIYRIVEGQNHEMYFFCLFSGKIVKVNNLKEKKILDFEMPISEQDKRGHYSRIELVTKSGNYIFFQSRFTGQIYILNVLNDEIQTLDILVPKGIRNRLMKKMFDDLIISKETNSMNIKDFIEFVKYF